MATMLSMDSAVMTVGKVIATMQMTAEARWHRSDWTAEQATKAWLDAHPENSVVSADEATRTLVVADTPAQATVGMIPAPGMDLETAARILQARGEDVRGIDSEAGWVVVVRDAAKASEESVG